MRNRKPIPTKVVSATPQGEVVRVNTKPSTHSRILHLCNALGIDVKEHQFKASIQMYNRMINHPTLGINL